MRQERFGSPLKLGDVIRPAEGLCPPGPHSMSTEQNRHTCSRSVVLNEEGKRRYKLVSARRMISPCCARTASGHAAAAPSSVMNSRRPISNTETFSPLMRA
jgi:hypothetical protein